MRKAFPEPDPLQNEGRGACFARQMGFIKIYNVLSASFPVAGAGWASASPWAWRGFPLLARAEDGFIFRAVLLACDFSLYLSLSLSSCFAPLLYLLAHC